ncbi:HDOD domain-containing protein [Undibacterium seohonense]|jgi:EAL and modified HD-GYP domain-containing signal transduction protein|uniref:HDOD domain-containing protein n=1 Tax=Undibacterium seohonense TaxID=1344950 RepID=A0ABR6X8Q4_9BURK|nr:HDOD domain-containing protein [Undibacterium seohonense]MBC3809033.1 HDOD domain-containing protein [Undibacterium seohonense]
MIPIATLLPIVNSQHKILGLMPSFKEANDAHCLSLLSYLNQVSFFEAISPLLFFVPLSNPNNLALDFETRDYAKHVVLCIQESSCESKEVQQRLKHLHQSGVRLMMDDFNSKAQLLWPDTRGIAVNCESGVPSHIQPWIFSLQHSQHLAKNLNSLHYFEQAQNAGFSFFSGDFAFCSTNSSRASDATARSRLLKLLGLVSKDAETKELETLFKQDPTLSFMLFKLVSSAAFAQTVKVSSFIQAINLLGRRQLQRWLQLLLYARQNGQGASLNPLMLRAAYRASCMEALCRQQGGDKDEQDAAFMVGMFSLLDLLFACPLWEILKPLSLNDDVRAALLERTGILGQNLRLVESSDRSFSDGFVAASSEAQLVAENYYQNLAQAYTWVNQVCQDM